MCVCLHAHSTHLRVSSSNIKQIRTYNMQTVSLSVCVCFLPSLDSGIQTKGVMTVEEWRRLWMAAYGPCWK